MVADRSFGDPLGSPVQLNRFHAKQFLERSLTQGYLGILCPPTTCLLFLTEVLEPSLDHVIAEGT